MTINQKKAEIDQWFKNNYNQLLINTKKVTTTRFNMFGIDLLTHIVQDFLSKSIEDQYIILDEGNLENYLTKNMSLQIKSSSSPFYYKYRKSTMAIRELLPIDYSRYDNNDLNEEDKNLQHKLIDCIKQEIELLNPYERELINQKLANGEKYEDLWKKWKISKSHLVNDLKIIKHNIRCNCIKKLKIQ